MEKVKRKLTHTKRYMLTMAFCVRIAQTVLLGVAPSVMSVLLLYLNPNERVWSVSSGLAFFIFLFGTFYFCYRFIMDRMNILEYYIVNISVWFLYAFLSVFLLNFANDAIEYSWLFADMRFFESLTAFIPSLIIKTKNSIMMTNGCLLVAIVAAERIASIKIKKILWKTSQEMMISDEAPDESLLKEDVAPVQNNEQIKIMSSDEIEETMMRDAMESREVIEGMIHGERNNDILDGGEITQGKGRKVERIDYSTLSDEEIMLDAVKRDNSSMEDYDSDSLWNKDIYNRNSDIEEDYGDDIFLNDDKEESLWNPDAIKGRKRLKKSELYAESETINTASDNDNYDSDSLWNKEIYSGGRAFDPMSEEEEIQANDTAESLWNIGAVAGRDRLKKSQLYNETAGLERVEDENEYDSDSLWSEEFYKKNEARISPEDDELSQASSANDEYDSDSLWNIDPARMGTEDEEK